MPFALRHLKKITDLPYNTTGGFIQLWGYADAASLAAVLAAGYFNDARARLQVNDLIDVVATAGGAGEAARLRVTAAPSSGNVLVTADPAEEGGTAREVVPTADGLTTGLILSSDSYINVTSAGANDIITLPAIGDVPLGKEIWGKNGATACEMRTPATSNTPINGTDADSTEAVIAANVAFMVKKISATAWALLTLTGGAVAAPTPD